jgi:hypothetical protein
MKPKYALSLITFLIVSYGIAQVTFFGNGNSGFGDAIGSGNIVIQETAGTITINITKGTADFNDTMVIYFDTGAPGRTVINSDVEDFQDQNRQAISSAGPNSSTITFPPGFEATHAIAVNTGFGGLWSIPATGFVVNDGLPFVTAVGQPASNTSSLFQMTFTYANLGITNTADGFDFVATYLNGGNGFLSNEGYGTGFISSNHGDQRTPLNFETYFSYPDDAIYGIARTSASGFYNSNLVWQNGNIPAATDRIIIDHSIATDIPVTVDNEMIINASKSLTISANQTLTLNGSLQNDGQLTFDSNANGSAQLINGTSASISQPVNANRFIPALTHTRRAFRFVTSSVTTTGSIYDNWQTAGASVPGVGTHITGSTTGANGFDTTISGEPSMFTYGIHPVSGTLDWYEVANTDVANLAAGKPYRLFIRGDRNYNLLSSPTDPVNSDVILPVTGTLNLAATVNSGALNSSAGDFSFVGNPYQATVDMNLVSKNNINPNFIYVWNPNASTRGAYETVLVDGMNPDANQYVQPGQSFFVTTVANGPAALDFKAADKVVAQNSVGLFSTSNNRPEITISLSPTGTINNRLDLLRIFMDGDNTVNTFDALKLQNLDESLSCNKNGQLFSIENKAMPVDGEVIALDIQNYRTTAYSFSIALNNLNAGISAKLHDSYLNTNHDLNDGDNTISFTADPAITGATATNRFSLQFTNTTLSEMDKKEDLFSFYPNPTENSRIVLKLNRLQPGTDLNIYDTLGQLVYTAQMNETTASLDLTTIGTGIYFIKVRSGDQSTTKKLLIK